MTPSLSARHALPARRLYRARTVLLVVLIGIGLGSTAGLAAEPAVPIGDALALTHQQMRAPAGARVEIEAGSLDSRLRLAPCAKIEPYLPSSSRPWGRTRVGLRCVSGPVRWNVYLPVTVRVYAPAVVLRDARPAGTRLEAGDLEIAEVDIASASSPTFGNLEDVTGRTLATPLAGGAPVRADHLRLRQWFNAGDTVTIVASGPGYSVSGEGTALGHGLEGQSVRVRTDNGRVITGWASGQRRVEVPM